MGSARWAARNWSSSRAFGLTPSSLTAKQSLHSPASVRTCSEARPSPVNKSVWIKSYVEGVSIYRIWSPSLTVTETDTPGSDPELFLVPQPNGGITREPFGGCNGPPNCDYGEVRVPGCTHNASGPLSRASLMTTSTPLLPLPACRAPRTPPACGPHPPARSSLHFLDSSPT